jgi:hypothetical protein
MKRLRGTLAGPALSLAVVVGLSGWRGKLEQPQAPVGYLSGDRVVAMAAAADASIASFTPSPEALASFAALVDPLHLRVFFRSAQPEDAAIAAKIARTVEAPANPALTAEFVAVSDDLAEPKGPIADNGVTKAPEIIVYWMGQEVGRMHPEPGAAIDGELADFIHQARAQLAQEMLLDNEFFKYTYHKDLLELDCKRCHGPKAMRREEPPSIFRPAAVDAIPGDLGARRIGAGPRLRPSGP